MAQIYQAVCLHHMHCVLLDMNQPLDVGLAAGIATPTYSPLLHASRASWHCQQLRMAAKLQSYSKGLAVAACASACGDAIVQYVTDICLFVPLQAVSFTGACTRLVVWP